MRHRMWLRQTAVMALSAFLERRTDGGFSPILNGGLVLPGEPIRLRAGDSSAFGGEAEFVIKDATGLQVFRATAGWSFFGGMAIVDTVAPVPEGNYVLHVAQSAFGIVTRLTVDFVVSTAAPPPPPPPPGSDWLGDVKWIVIVIAVVVLISQAGKLIPQRKG